MRVAIVGSRDIDDMLLLREVIGDSMFKISHVISGGAKGVDTLAEQWARQNRMPITIWYANWEKYGRGAGPIRNGWVVRDSDAMIAIRHEVSRGTEDAVRQATKKGIPIHERVVV